ncbi:hypothetical protein B0T16DRAFT_169043 [Cercophora newfieldiana]|uniref:Uncharacterized protein n=1 Tax=Cercophora newfieldiana TaxID=92897 RepID=A0AA40CRF1_9PEZI|nr:hypothetical protein B0T16DRAFT_169043 [Cercophora newfieldiana]
MAELDSDDTQKLILAVTGRHIDPEIERDLRRHAVFYACHAADNILRSGHVSHRLLPDSSSGPGVVDDAGPDLKAKTILQLLALCANALREDHNCSAQDLATLAAGKDLFRRDCLGDPDLALQATKAIYHIVGRITMLFELRATPAHVPLESLTVSSGDGRFPAIIVPPDEYHERPLFELLCRFENLLPQTSTAQDSIQPDSSYALASTAADSGASPNSQTLIVSCVCADTLCKFGGFSIVWTKSLAAHLCFDQHSRQLYLFSTPSYCDISRFEDGVFSKVLDYYFDDRMTVRPTYFTPAQYAKEIHASYGLLFADDKRSRKLWRKQVAAEAAAASGGVIDPWLEALATGTNRGGAEKGAKQSLRTTYSLSTDFPIFAMRLRALQNDILSQQPNEFLALWHDRRDLLKWSQFWLILIVSAVGLLLSVLQTAFTLVQTVYVIKEAREGNQTTES